MQFSFKWGDIFIVGIDWLLKLYLIIAENSLFQIVATFGPMNKNRCYLLDNASLFHILRASIETCLSWLTGKSYWPKHRQVIVWAINNFMISPIRAIIVEARQHLSNGNCIYTDLTIKFLYLFIFQGTTLIGSHRDIILAGIVLYEWFLDQILP